MREQATTQKPVFSRKTGFYRVTFALLSLILILSVMTLILAPAWLVAAQGPTPTLLPATWATPMGGGTQALPGETDWVLVGLIVTVVVMALALLLLLFFFFLRAGRREPAPAMVSRAYPPPAQTREETLAGAGAVASLTIQKGPGAGQSFTLSKPETVIGRYAGNDMVVQHNEVSRRHASITREGGGFVLRDLGSRNGTFVNRRRLSGPQALRDGDLIMLGEGVHLVFRASVRR
jgi:hypothetical protein